MSVGDTELLDLIERLAQHRPRFFIRYVNEHWEAGWGDPAGLLTERAETLRGAVQLLWTGYGDEPRSV